MGWYKCPRCGGTDSFQGTELVTHTEKSSAATVHTEYGSFTQNTGGQSHPDEVVVFKCRECGELLSAKDYQYTQEELEELRRQQRAEAEKWRWYHYLLLLVAIYLALVIVGGGLRLGPIGNI